MKVASPQIPTLYLFSLYDHRTDPTAKEDKIQVLVHDSIKTVYCEIGTASFFAHSGFASLYLANSVVDMNLEAIR